MSIVASIFKPLRFLWLDLPKFFLEEVDRYTVTATGDPFAYRWPEDYLGPSVGVTLERLSRIFRGSESAAVQEQLAFRLITSFFNGVAQSSIDRLADEFLSSLVLDNLPTYVVEYILIVTELRAHKTPVRRRFEAQFHAHLGAETDEGLIGCPRSRRVE